MLLPPSAGLKGNGTFSASRAFTRGRRVSTWAVHVSTFARQRCGYPYVVTNSNESMNRHHREQQIGGSDPPLGYDTYIWLHVVIMGRA